MQLLKSTSTASGLDSIAGSRSGGTTAESVSGISSQFGALFRGHTTESSSLPGPTLQCDAGGPAWSLIK